MPPVSELIALMEMLVTHAPALTMDSVKLYSDVAHGEGGLGKVQNALSDLTKLVADAAGASAA